MHQKHFHLLPLIDLPLFVLNPLLYFFKISACQSLCALVVICVRVPEITAELIFPMTAYLNRMYGDISLCKDVGNYFPLWRFLFPSGHIGSINRLGVCKTYFPPAEHNAAKDSKNDKHQQPEAVFKDSRLFKDASDNCTSSKTGSEGPLPKKSLSSLGTSCRSGQLSCNNETSNLS